MLKRLILNLKESCLKILKIINERKMIQSQNKQRIVKTKKLNKKF